jgi:hypothetical protein
VGAAAEVVGLVSRWYSLPRIAGQRYPLRETPGFQLGHELPGPRRRIDPDARALPLPGRVRTLAAAQSADVHQQQAPITERLRVRGVEVQSRFATGKSAGKSGDSGGSKGFRPLFSINKLLIYNGFRRVRVPPFPPIISNKINKL